MSTSRVYDVLVERTAERDLGCLPAADFPRIIQHIKALADNPRPSGCRKITGSRNDWRIRVGHDRVIYEIDEVDKAVKVLRVRHRREVYR